MSPVMNSSAGIVSKTETVSPASKAWKTITLVMIEMIVSKLWPKIASIAQYFQVQAKESAITSKAEEQFADELPEENHRHFADIGNGFYVERH
eukprot:CAMPEP_0172189054 /NCGR_PEP_ID=MMETSP1050-20130122/22302_1 /TAXON_ID=233186 /ORGANISM="Cryptomonas curvata, Strain CCAP979/52" /LENGTH=92 /DNA_ID=CAMNT_0012863689 /DNA_START=1666 /DNA_END=1941 /DNA_ORIENTATION=+